MTPTTVASCGSTTIGTTTTMTDIPTWTVALPVGYRPDRARGLFACGANARLHPMVRNRVTREIRGAAKIAARAARIPAMTGPVSILAVQHPATGARGLDADNIAPLVKPMIDGLRDAGVLVDDSRAYVTEVRYTVGAPTRLAIGPAPDPRRRAADAMTTVATTLVDCDGCGITARIASVDPAHVSGWLAGADWNSTSAFSLDFCPKCIQRAAPAGDYLDELIAYAAAELTTKTG